MRMVDLIEKKKRGFKYNKEELHYIIMGYVNGDIPDYQMSAWMMAVWFKGLDEQETAWLTYEMMHSGDVIDLSLIDGVKVDKHSTGGVGDKTSLVLGPMVAACGVNVAKMSGRGLGHTGGTLDKLEAIPGFQIKISEERFIEQVKRCHFAIIGQSKQLVPADKKMYALRDVTATVDCIPLIASSIMSKKLAAGSDSIMLDVKYGTGAFMKTKEDAIALAKTMVNIGKSLGKNTIAAITNMSQPLGYAIGNSLEVIEAINTLNGQGPDDLYQLCLQSGSQMLIQANKANNEKEAIHMLEEVIASGKALQVFKDMVGLQGGNCDYIDNIDLFKKANEIIAIKASKSGYIKDINAKELGIVSMKLGGGRVTKDDIIDHSVGIILYKKVGDYVNKGEVLLEVHTNNGLSDLLYNDLINAYLLTDCRIDKPKLIEEIVR